MVMRMEVQEGVGLVVMGLGMARVGASGGAGDRGGEVREAWVGFGGALGNDLRKKNRSGPSA